MSAAPYSTAVVGPCNGLIVGEIASTLEGFASEFDTDGAPLVDSTADFFVDLEEECLARHNVYAGLEAGLGGWRLPATAGNGVPWAPAYESRVVVIGPTPSQRAAGADWLACGTMALNGDSYEGSLRNAFTSGRLPDLYGRCWADREFLEQAASCRDKFLAQQLGWADQTRNSLPIDDATLDRTCLSFASMMIGVKDPTFGGQLEVVSSRDPAQTAYVYCDVLAPPSRPLNRSLIGIGEGSLPWAE